VDHDPEMLAAFTSFGAAQPSCSDVIDHWTHDPIRMLFRLPLSQLDNRTLALVVHDWVVHARRRSQQRHAKELQDADWDALITKAVARWRDNAQDHSFPPFRLPPNVTFADGAAAHYVQAAYAGRPSDRRSELLRAQHEALRAATGGPSPDEAAADEYKWQIAHAIRALASLQKGKPWPVLS
jgi:hypothetical protein